MTGVRNYACMPIELNCGDQVDDVTDVHVNGTICFIQPTARIQPSSELLDSILLVVGEAGS
jgi:hypothetical protein